MRLSDVCCCAMQAMADSTEALLATHWQHSGCRDVYKDFNALTLQITTQALFGNDLPAAEGIKVTGQALRCCMRAQQMPPAHLLKWESCGNAPVFLLVRHQASMSFMHKVTPQG